MDLRSSTLEHDAGAARSRRSGARLNARMAFATMAALASLAVLGATPARADPSKSFTFDLQCESLGTVTNATFSNGAASPGLVVDNNQVILPYAWEVDVEFTPTVGEPFSRVLSYARGEPQNGRLDRCTYHYVLTFPEGVGVFDGWALISYTA
jgi:hypothetical protein